ncbi:MAG TPA: isoaspartyl peptidase/L-asparaginase, partial [Tenuifilum sp.]|nr:isoaspartyl peptidase/L-asparaginase [Tenuifilum sp.]HRR10612.1 isoaspartyl peptidase/L-asparaginase [Tenuifilum sp.]HRS43444.1 isoaspartyl peptidase/L-asparaginase [Tenuifilum sp.]HRU85586.1 isoaspartyl peptidase/L-asparaginase [Tenuifilum sp.]
MRKKILVLLFIVGFVVSNSFPQTWSIAVHGGAGNMKPENFTKEQLDEYEREMKAALGIGVKILNSGGTSLDAVEQVVRYLEDCPLFNAGRGAVFTHEGRNELDAAIMDGKTLMAGSVAGVTDVKNPISLARKIMEDSPHVMLAGKGASEFAKVKGIEIVDTSYFFTPQRWNDLQRTLSKEKMGTVGCVAL